MKHASLLALALLAAAAATLAFAGASFTSASVNPANSVTMATLGAPSGLAAAPAGHDVQLSWTAGAGAGAYALRGAANGTSPDCGSATLDALATSAGTTYTDAARSTPEGTWFCYAVQSTYRSWSSPFTARVAVQLGVVAATVSLANAADTTGCASLSGAGWLDCGDRIVVEFNQPIDPATGPGTGDTICAASGTIVLAATATGGGCASTESRNLGALSGVTTTNSARFGAAYAWTNGNRTLTIDVRARVAGGKNVRLGDGTLTFAPSTDAADLRSATGGFHACDTDTGGSACRPAATGAL